MCLVNMLLVVEDLYWHPKNTPTTSRLVLGVCEAISVNTEQLLNFTVMIPTCGISSVLHAISMTFLVVPDGLLIWLEGWGSG